MNILINTEKLIFLKASSAPDSIKRLEVWAEILCPHDNYVIIGAEAKWYSRFSLAQLRILYFNSTGRRPLTLDYNMVLRDLANFGKDLEEDEMPYEKLLSKLGRPMPRENQESGPSAKMKRATKKELDHLFGVKQPVQPNTASSGTVTGRFAGKPKEENIRPKAGSKTGLVWDACDKLFVDGEPMPSKNEVVEACSSFGINPGTIGVQYGKWKRFKS